MIALHMQLRKNATLKISALPIGGIEDSPADKVLRFGWSSRCTKSGRRGLCLDGSIAGMSVCDLAPDARHNLTS